MSVRKLVLVVLALAVAGGTVQVSRALLSQSVPVAAPAAAPVQPVPATRVLVASGNLPAGTLIQPGHLQWRAWPEEEGLAKIYAVEGQRPAEDFHGAVVRRGLRAGEPLVDGAVVKPGDHGFLAAVLSPGTRAVSVAINGVTGIAGFVFPGDRVDLLLTHTIRNPEEPANERRASETVLSDIRVLALDQRIDDQKGEVKEARTATLEVTPRQAEKVAVAADMGQLSLSLRAVAAPGPDGVQLAAADGLRVTVSDAMVQPAHTITWDSDVSLALAPALAEPVPAPDSSESQPGAGAPSVVKVQVIRGGESAELSFPHR